MRVCQIDSAVVFDDPNLVSCAGLAPVLALAERCDLAGLVEQHLTLTAAGGVNAPVKVGALVGAMVAGADSIADTGLLRHGATGRLFGGVRAPSTLGTFLRSFTFGHVPSARRGRRPAASRAGPAQPAAGRRGPGGLGRHRLSR